MSSSPTPSSFFESLLYSRRGSGKNRRSSLARRSQELGARLCGRLSQIALEANPTAMVGSTTSFPSAVPLSYMEDVHRDLSAHYGSHAIRRGLSKPLGPCVHTVVTKGKFATQRTGVHNPQYMRLWVLRLVRRSWCPRCGVWLTRGGVHQSSKSAVRWSTLPTLRECCVRRQRRSPRLPTKRSRFMLCCIRCLKSAQRAAKRQMPLLQNAPGEQQQARGGAGKSGKRGTALPTRRVARGACTPSLERTLKAVMTRARVPRRNRRCRRHSQRRRRSTNEEAQGGSIVKAPARSKSASATLQMHNSASQLTRTLAAALTRKVTSPTSIGDSEGVPSALARGVQATARTAQRNLQSLVPSGPLRKSTSHISLPGRLGRNPEHSPASRPGALRGDGAVAEQFVVASEGCLTPPSARSSHKNATDRSVHLMDRPADRQPDERTETARKMKKSYGAVSPSTPPATVEPPVVVNPLPSSASTAPRVRLASAEVMGSVPLASQPIKPAARPPAKVATSGKAPATAKRKLMDTMNQLGF